MAANPERGEFDVDVDGTTYTLKLTMEAALQAQRRTKKTMGELFLAASRMDWEAIRELLWVLTQAHHADEFKTLQSVHKLVDALGSTKVLFQYEDQVAKYEAEVKRTQQAMEPDEGNPQRAQAGTGDGSRSSPDASA
jgi:hypothetical protein